MTTKTKRRARRTPAVQSPVGRAGAFTPDAISVRPRALEVGGEWVSSFAITGYPREVHPGWLQPLLTYPGPGRCRRCTSSRSTRSPRPTGCKKQLSEAGVRAPAHQRHGRLIDPQVEAATEDAYDLAARVARGEGKLFRLGLYLTVHAADRARPWPTRSPRSGRWPRACCWTPSPPPTAACRAGSPACRWAWT